MTDGTPNQGLQGLLFLTALTAIHPGAGTSFGVVDLTIQREKTSGFPFIQSTGLKGVMRDTARSAWQKQDNDSDIRTIFGASLDAGGGQAGAFTVTDARLLLLPVRSLAGLFAYTTCPYVLNRLRREAQLLAGITGLPEVPELNDPEAAFTGSGNGTTSPLMAYDQKVVLEDLRLGIASSDIVRAWAQKFEAWVGSAAYRLTERLLVVHDEVFAHLCDTGVAVHHRNSLLTDGSKRVKDGGLFNQEFLCEHSVMYTILRVPNGRLTQDKLDILKKLCGLVWQAGKNETTGKGFLQPTLVMQ